MTEYRLILVAGARPNFMKIAPLMDALADHPYIRPYLVHTGQHYDEKMSALFFQQLNIPQPDINLEVGSSSHAVQTALIMERFEKVCLNVKPHMVMVVGDVNSTAACTLVAAKLHIPTAHYEAGLRSRDRSMPEEINRLVTDAISDYFFTTSVDADENLINEGISHQRIFMVGNLMIDSLYKHLKIAEAMDHRVETLDRKRIIHLGETFQDKKYGIMTFHRPSNVDQPETLAKLVKTWGAISQEIPLLFPIHPRTVKNLIKFGLFDILASYETIYLTEPMGYLEFIYFIYHAAFALTDSGGIQEETTTLKIPCLTIRPTTERPITLWEGSNKLIRVEDIEKEVHFILQGKGKTGNIPKYWDGQSAGRIVKILEDIFNSSMKRE
ncbi:MAG: UDP-N-acetylglucosamine 2-epimerase (non-hydrolyzing) [Candidatus Marinimicrobia bacterium]|nr:UDP-N-acetylglucosamine 2-epimerase (non-hydrolyzing) [Candidatus Neomarinimicrobiota bacterium]